MFYDWDWLAAESEAQRAIELNPNNQGAHLLYYWYLLAMGRHSEAIAEIKKAQEIDPLSLLINTSLGWSLYTAREYDQAIEQYTKVLEMDPNFLPVYVSLAMAYVKKKWHKETIAAIERTRDISEYSTHTLSVLGYAYAVSGNRKEAQKVLDGLTELSMKTKVRTDPFDIAVVYSGLGERDQAFEWLQNAYEYRSPPLVWLTVEHVWDNLRSDSRFTELLRRIGLTP